MVSREYVPVPGANFVEVIRHYREQQEMVCPKTQVHYSTQPLIMHELVYHTLCEYGQKLLPHLRDVLLCFEHVAYNACLQKEVKDKLSTTTPMHCIVLQVKFLHTNMYFNVGTIGYKAFTQREYVAELIKEYIEDCFRADVRVVATCSSGQFEIMNILTEMPIKYLVKNALITYPLRGRGRILHIFDPSWLMRKMKGKFFTSDVTFTFEHQRYVSSFDNIQAMLCHPRLIHLFTSEIYDKCLKTTSSAAKMFSATTSVLLEGLYNNTSDSFPKQPDAIGTKIFCQIFDQIFDSFNACVESKDSPKIFRSPVTSKSPHSEMWDAYIPVLTSMRFNSQPPEALSRRMRLPAPVYEKLQQDMRSSSTLDTHDCSNCELIKAEEGGIPIEYYSDNEYNSVEPGENHTDLVSLLATFLKHDQNERDATLPMYLHEVSDQLKGTCLARSIMRQEALSKELYSLTMRIKQHRLKAVNGTLVKNVLVLLNTASIYNDELKLTYSKSFTYEYLSIHMEMKLKYVACALEDSSEFYTKLLNELTSIVDTLRFLNLSVFQCWLASIAGVRKLFDILTKRHCKEFNTKIVNCDTIHNYIQILRKENGLPTRVLVETPMFDEGYNISALAMTEQFNWTITTTLFEADEPKSTEMKKSRRGARKRNKIAEGNNTIYPTKD